MAWSKRVPRGGFNGQVLCKESDNEFDVFWKDVGAALGPEGITLPEVNNFDPGNLLLLFENALV